MTIVGHMTNEAALSDEDIAAIVAAYRSRVNVVAAPAAAPPVTKRHDPPISGAEAASRAVAMFNRRNPDGPALAIPTESEV